MKKMMLGLGLVLMLSGCGVTSAPIMGAFYTDVTSGQEVTGNRLAQKVGRSKASGFLGLVATGDASYQTAAKNGGITRITHVDVHNHSILGIITTYETIVYGE